MDAYEKMIRETSTPQSPWYVVPADNKWFTRIVVASAIVDALASLDLHYPKVGAEKLAELAAAKKALLPRSASARSEPSTVCREAADTGHLERGTCEFDASHEPEHVELEAFVRAYGKPHDARERRLVAGAAGRARQDLAAGR